MLKRFKRTLKRPFKSVVQTYPRAKATWLFALRESLADAAKEKIPESIYLSSKVVRFSFGVK